MYYTTQDNQEKRIKSLADLFLIINKLNLKDKSMQKTFKTSSTLSLNSILMLTFLFRELGIAFAFGKCSGLNITVNLMRIAIVTHARDCQWMYTIYQNQNGKKWLQQSFNIWSIHTVERLVGLHSDTCIYPPIMYTTFIILNAIKMQYFLNSFKTNDSCLSSYIVKPKLVLEDCNCNFLSTTG